MKPRVIILDYAIHATCIFEDAKGKKHTRCVIDDVDFAAAKVNSACSWNDESESIPVDMTNKDGKAKVTFLGEPFGSLATKEIEQPVVK